MIDKAAFDNLKDRQDVKVLIEIEGWWDAESGQIYSDTTNGALGRRLTDRIMLMHLAPKLGSLWKHKVTNEKWIYIGDSRYASALSGQVIRDGETDLKYYLIEMDNS